jgi:hypothetical protein
MHRPSVDDVFLFFIKIFYKPVPPPVSEMHTVDLLFIAVATGFVVFSLYAQLAINNVMRRMQRARLTTKQFTENKQCYARGHHLMRAYAVALVVWLLVSCLYVNLWQTENLWLYVVIGFSLIVAPFLLRRLLSKLAVLWHQIHVLDYSLQKVLKEATLEKMRQDWQTEHFRDAWEMLGLAPDAVVRDDPREAQLDLVWQYLEFYRGNRTTLPSTAGTNVATRTLSEKIKEL